MKVVQQALIPIAALFLSGTVVFAQQPTVQERVVALKASLTASQALLKQYEWVETSGN